MNEREFAVACYGFLLALKGKYTDDPEALEALNAVLAEAPVRIRYEGARTAGRILESL